MAVFYVLVFGTVHRVHVSVVHIYHFLIDTFMSVAPPHKNLMEYPAWNSCHR